MNPHRRAILMAAVASAAVSPLSALAQAPADAALTAAINGRQRSAANKARDAFRRPVETLQFWGLKPGMTVLEINPGGGYWTEILAPYLKATGGKYIATGAKPASVADEAIWGQTVWVPFSMTSPALAPAGSVDLVITARNIHNWMWTPGMLDKALKDFGAALKPGGLLGVEEHRSDPRPMVAEARDGYVATAHVIGEAQKTGFALDAQSEVNANPKDKKDHPFGVWTLPRPAATPAAPTSPRRRTSTVRSMTRLARATA